MSTLESIVPPLDLCKRIPDGAFDDSALAWVVVGDGSGGERWYLVERKNVGETKYPEIHPAPTLAEIIDALHRAEFASAIYSCGDSWTVKAVKHNINEFKWDEKPATAALNLWLALNKEYEK